MFCFFGVFFALLLPVYGAEAWDEMLEEQPLTPLLIQAKQSICHWHFWVSLACSVYLKCAPIFFECVELYIITRKI